MVNPGAFLGSRLVFMQGETEAYARAVSEGLAGEGISNTQQRYFKRYPIDLPHDVEPTIEFLESVNDEAPDPEPVKPDLATMTPEQYEIAGQTAKARKKAVQYWKGQIKRWLEYQHSKTHKKKKGPDDPYAVLVQRLIGKDTTRPRLKSPPNLWRKGQAQRDMIEAELQAMTPAVQPWHLATTRDVIARRLFSELDVGEQRKWKRAAADAHTIELAEYNATLEDEPSEEPAERQRAIECLVRFMQPILDSVCQTTGWKATFIAGGPEPAHDGLLSMISIHSGFTSGDIKMNFGQAERLAYKKYIVPVFGSFLQRCYTPAECKARALAKEDGFHPMSTSTSEDFDNGDATLDHIAVAPKHTVSSSHPPTSSPPQSYPSTSSPPQSYPSTSSPPQPYPPTSSPSYGTQRSLEFEFNSNPFPYGSHYTFDDEDPNYRRGSSPTVKGVRPHSAPTSPAPSPAAQLEDPHAEEFSSGGSIIPLPADSNESVAGSSLQPGAQAMTLLLATTALGLRASEPITSVQPLFVSPAAVCGASDAAVPVCSAAPAQAIAVLPQPPHRSTVAGVRNVLPPSLSSTTDINAHFPLLPLRSNHPSIVTFVPSAYFPAQPTQPPSAETPLADQDHLHAEPVQTEAVPIQTPLKKGTKSTKGKGPKGKGKGKGKENEKSKAANKEKANKKTKAASKKAAVAQSPPTTAAQGEPSANNSGAASTAAPSSPSVVEGGCPTRKRKSVNFGPELICDPKSTVIAKKIKHSYSYAPRTPPK